MLVVTAAKQFFYTTLLILLLALASGAQAKQSLPDLVQSGNREAALNLIKSKTDINVAQADGTTALHWAVFNVDEELTKKLLDAGANPNVINSFGSFPLAEAARLSNINMAKMLLKAKADPNIANQDKQTALMIASKLGNFDIVKQLVKAGANVNTIETYQGQNALMWAAANNHGEVAKYLVSKGADVNLRAYAYDWGSQITSEPRAQYRPSGGLTPLLYAARGGCLECVKAILKKGVNINLPDPDGVTPLMVAIDSFNFEVAKYLLSQGANPHPWDWWGRTALYIAVDVVNYRGGGFGGEDTAPEAANDAKQASALDIVELLLQAGVNPDSQLNMHRPGRGGGNGRFTDDVLNTGATPLLRAAETHDIETVKLLLQYNADVNLPNAMGVTPLLGAAGMGGTRGLLGGAFPPSEEKDALETVKILIAAGADAKARITDTTSFTARLARRTDMTDRTGQTALHVAAKQGWQSVFEYLMQQGVDPKVVDEKGHTVLDCANRVCGGREGPPTDLNVKMAAYVKGLNLGIEATRELSKN